MSAPSIYDVVVIGGGAGGTAAAVGAARSGARVLLVERYGISEKVLACPRLAAKVKQADCREG